MQVTLLTAGLVCVIGAIIGGGLKAFEIEMPGLDSIGRQVLLGATGTAFVAMALFGVGADDDPVDSATPPTTGVTPSAPTGNLVRNPGAELGPAIAPFSPPQPPEHWKQDALFAVVAAFGDFGEREGCIDAGYPQVGELLGTGKRFFSGGFGPQGGCNLGDGDISSLVQDIDVTDRGTVSSWSASAKLGSYPQATDTATLTVLALDEQGDVLDEETTGPVTNPADDFALQTRSMRGTLPDGTATVRIALDFTASSGWSGAYADDVEFVLEP